MQVPGKVCFRVGHPYKACTLTRSIAHPLVIPAGLDPLHLEPSGPDSKPSVVTQGELEAAHVTLSRWVNSLRILSTSTSRMG